MTRLRDQLQRADDRSLLIRDTQATLAEESEDMLRRKIKEIGSKLADTKRVSMKVRVVDVSYLRDGQCGWNSGLTYVGSHCPLLSHNVDIVP